MVKSCSAINCKSRYIKGSKVSFHSFPSRDPRQVRAWCVAMRRKGFRPSIHSALCSKHFTPDSFQTSCRTRTLKIDAMPTIFNFGGIVTNNSRLKKYPPTLFNKSTPKPYKTVNIQSNESTGTGKEASSLKENPSVVEILKTNSTPRPNKTMNFQSSESTDTGKKVYSVKGNPSVFLIVNTNSTPKLNNTVNFESNERTDTGKKAYSVKENPSVAKIVKTNSSRKNTEEDTEIDSFPSDQFSNTKKEIEFLRETIDHLRKKVKRFECLTNVLQSNELISEEAAEVLRSTIEM